MQTQLSSLPAVERGYNRSGGWGKEKGTMNGKEMRYC